MYKLIFLCFLGVLLTACSALSIHKVEVEQGNIVTSAAVNRLHPGMSEEQAKEIMGRPILVHMLDANRLLYVYTFQVGSNPRIEKRVALTFSHGVLQTIERYGV